MTVDSVITSVFDTEDFAQYEQKIYEKYQEIAEHEIIIKLNELLSNPFFLLLLKQWSGQCACRFLGHREITVRLKSGKRWKILSPRFPQSKTKEKTRPSPEATKGSITASWTRVIGDP